MFLIKDNVRSTTCKLNVLLARDTLWTISCMRVYSFVNRGHPVYSEFTFTFESYMVEFLLLLVYSLYFCTSYQSLYTCSYIILVSILYRYIHAYIYLDVVRLFV